MNEPLTDADGLPVTLTGFPVVKWSKEEWEMIYGPTLKIGVLVKIPTESLQFNSPTLELEEELPEPIIVEEKK